MGALAALVDRYYETQARLDPLYSATLAGDNRFDDQLPITIAPTQRKKRFAVYHQVQQQLAAIDKRRLGRGDTLTYDLLARELRTRIGFERFGDQAIVNMREGIRRRIVQPKPVVTAALAQIRSLRSESLSDNPFCAPIKNLPASFSDQDRRRLTAAYQEEVAEHIAHSMRRLADFLEKDHHALRQKTARARGSTGP